MLTCSECFGTSPEGSGFCIHCGAPLPETEVTDRLGDRIGELPVGQLYYRENRGLWYKLSPTSHAPVELKQFSLVGRGPMEDLNVEEVVQRFIRS